MGLVDSRFGTTVLHFFHEKKRLLSTLNKRMYCMLLFPLFIHSLFHFIYFILLILWLLSSLFLFFCSIFCSIFFHIRCPAGQIRVSPDRAECVYDTDCFGVNKCLNGGTCVSKTPFATSTSTCICPPFFDGARCEIVTDAKYVITGGKDFVIIIIFSLAILLSKFYFSSVFFSFFSNHQIFII